MLDKEIPPIIASSILSKLETAFSSTLEKLKSAVKGDPVSMSLAVENRYGDTKLVAFLLSPTKAFVEKEATAITWKQMERERQTDFIECF